MNRKTAVSWNVKEEQREAFQDIRLSLYLTAVITGILVYFLPIRYLCNTAGHECPFCGLKTAVYDILHGRFSESYESNPMIILLIIILLLMMVDTFRILIVRYRKRIPVRKS